MSVRVTSELIGQRPAMLFQIPALTAAPVERFVSSSRRRVYPPCWYELKVCRLEIGFVEVQFAPADLAEE